MMIHEWNRYAWFKIMLEGNRQIDFNWCMVFMHFDLKDDTKQTNKKATEAAFYILLK